MSKKWKIALIWLGGIIVIALVVFVGMQKTAERKVVEEKVSEMNIDDVDVDAYYKETSTVLDAYKVEDSDKVQTEKQAIDDFEQRGFEACEVFYDYDYDGEYLGDQEATKSKKIHPMYQTFYESSSGDLWSIALVNGEVTANPVSYNMQEGLEMPTIISESETIIGYDSETNTFYETIPFESTLNVKIVDKLDAETLDSLTKEVIAGL